MGMEVTCLRHSSSNLEKVLVRQTRAVARMPIRYLRRPRVLDDHRDDWTFAPGRGGQPGDLANSDIVCMLGQVYTRRAATEWVDASNAVETLL